MFHPSILPSIRPSIHPITHSSTKYSTKSQSRGDNRDQEETGPTYSLKAAIPNYQPQKLGTLGNT